jgi:hypothetical protein
MSHITLTDAQINFLYTLLNDDRYTDDDYYTPQEWEIHKNLLVYFKDLKEKITIVDDYSYGCFDDKQYGNGTL